VDKANLNVPNLLYVVELTYTGDKPREPSQPHPPNRNTSTSTPDQRSGRNTPEMSTTTTNTSSTIIPSEVKEYMRLRIHH